MVNNGIGIGRMEKREDRVRGKKSKKNYPS